MDRDKELKKLLEKYSTGTCSADEIMLLKKWFEEMGDNEIHYELSGKTRLKMLRNITGSSEQDKKASFQFSRLLKMAAAACAAGILFFTSYLLTKPVSSESVQLFSYQTGVGEIKTIRLPDSSLVWLNAKSEIKYPKNFGEDRTVALKGEAFFDVAPDKDHPFTVFTSDSLQTTVLGTSFNINSYENASESKITVLTGKVQVEQKKKAGKIGILSANESIVYHHQIQSYEKKNIDAGSLVAWRTGSWKLQINSITDLTLIMENHFGIKMIVDNENSGLTEVDMNFSNKQKPEEIIKVFSLLTGYHYKWIDGTTIELY